VLNRLPHFLVLFAAVALLAGCSRDLGPKTYTAEVKANYTSTCEDGADDKLGVDGAKTYCECTYDAISAPAPAGIHFDKFKDFETFLRKNVSADDINTYKELDDTNKFDDILKLFNDCAPVGPTSAGSSATTTIPTTTTAR